MSFVQDKFVIKFLQLLNAQYFRLIKKQSWGKTILGHYDYFVLEIKRETLQIMLTDS